MKLNCDAIQTQISRYPKVQSNDTYELYTLCWSAKEAVYKWWGKGGIDFKKNIKILHINTEENVIMICFTKSLFELELTLHYKTLDTFTLVWLSTFKFP